MTVATFPIRCRYVRAVWQPEFNGINAPRLIANP